MKWKSGKRQCQQVLRKRERAEDKTACVSSFGMENFLGQLDTTCVE